VIGVGSDTELVSLTDTSRSVTMGIGTIVIVHVTGSSTGIRIVEEVRTGGIETIVVSIWWENAEIIGTG
jgi:hypothetical protein